MNKTKSFNKLELAIKKGAPYSIDLLNTNEFNRQLLIDTVKMKCRELFKCELSFSDEEIGEKFHWLEWTGKVTIERRLSLPT